MPAAVPLAIAGASIVGSVISSRASKSAANAQADAANHASDLQNQNFQQTKQSLQPFVDTGYDAQNSLRSLLGIGTNDGSSTFGSLLKPFDAQTFQKYQDPGYQFQLQQGQNALQNSQAAQSGVLGGSALKDLVGFNQGMASTAYENAFGRYMDTNNATYQRLSSLLGIGENAAAGTGNMGVQAMANIGNTLTSGAAAQAAGRVGSANAWTSGINNGMGYYMLNNMLNQGSGYDAGAARAAYSSSQSSPYSGIGDVTPGAMQAPSLPSLGSI